jgi:hypothetical protein
MNTLESVIRGKRLGLGDTPAGADWVLQALHPSAGPFALRGIPDEDAFPSVCMDYETVVAIPPPSGATGTWNCVLNVLPHPLQPASFITTATGGQTGYGGITNPCYPATGGVYSTIAAGFAAQCTAYRMLYCGATVDLDASALTNGGSVVAAQMPIARVMRNYSLSSTTDPYCNSHISDTNYDLNFPGVSVSQLPGAFMGLSRDGCYMPVKLDPTSNWVSTLDVELANLSNPAGARATTTLGAGLRQLLLPLAAQAAGTTFPWYGSAYYGNSALFQPCYVQSSTGLLSGDVSVPIQQKNTGIIVFYNLNTSANLTVKLRWGVELRVNPTSPLAPAMQPAAVHDSLAMVAYTDLAGQLPWAFPSSYNAENTLMDIIGRVWRRMQPIVQAGLGAIPHPLAQLASAAVGTMKQTGADVVSNAGAGNPTKSKRARKAKA